MLPHELLNIDTNKEEYSLNYLKVAHEVFTWNGRKYHVVGRYGGHKWHGFGLRLWMYEKHSLSIQVFC